MRKTRYFVTMIDSFMSGWGMSKDKRNVYMVECETYSRALEIEKIARSRPEMKYVRLRVLDRKPYYNKNRFYVSHVLGEEIWQS